MKERKKERKKTAHVNYMHFITLNPLLHDIFSFSLVTSQRFLPRLARGTIDHRLLTQRFSPPFLLMIKGKGLINKPLKINIIVLKHHDHQKKNDKRAGGARIMDGQMNGVFRQYSIPGADPCVE